MLLQYKDEFIFSPEKSACQVLNVSLIDFSDGLLGRKSKETMVLKANGNEKIETVNSRGLVEATYITKEGDAIFYNNEKVGREGIRYGSYHGIMPPDAHCQHNDEKACQHDKYVRGRGCHPQAVQMVEKPYYGIG